MIPLEAKIMKLLIVLSLTLSLMLLGVQSASGAPLFSDSPAEHWAMDAVANLAAKGLVEGYADGTFKGDRTATRYEMALVVARFLAKNDQEHATYATKADLETLRILTLHLKDELDALGVRVTNLEENTRRLDLRVAEKERITYEGDCFLRCVSIGIRNTGRTDTTWAPDVGNVNALNFYRGHKYGTVDLLNGRPLVNGSSYTMRTRLGVKAKVTEDISAGLRIAGFTSYGDPTIDAYWGVPAPYLSNHFASNGYYLGTMESMLNTPWTRFAIDNFVVEHHKAKTRVTLGSITETDMDNFILSKIPNPNIQGKSMAKFSEKIITDRKKEEVVTLRYYEDEETYLPFYGAQVKGKLKLFAPMDWELMGSKLPFGANPTEGANQPATNDVTYPLCTSFHGTWHLGDRGSVRLNLLKATEEFIPDGTLIPNHGNYFFWTDPLGYAEVPINKRPMRGNAYVSQQMENSLGLCLNYRFEPSCIRALLAFGSTEYKPNIESGYSVKGNHFRAGLGWTNVQNTLRLNMEYLSTDPYYDPFQLYFLPLGTMALGGVPPGTPIAFSVVPSYYGGFPGSYAPFGYQLHDSGLYPNNREGFRFGGEYRLPSGKGALNVRYMSFAQHTPTVPQQDSNGFFRGLTPGFIDPVFHPVRTNGVKIFETPRGYQSQMGGGIAYSFGKLKSNVQYDTFSFVRSTGYAPNTLTAKTNYVNLGYKVLQVGLEYPTSKKFTLQGGFEQTSVEGSHPVIRTLYAAPAGTQMLNITQTCPYLGYEYAITENTMWKFRGRLISNVDGLTDPVSPESFAGTQFFSDFSIKF